MVTTEFRDAAARQSKTLGFDPGIVWVPHPIQNRTARELEAIAEEAIDSILSMIRESAPANR